MILRPRQKELVGRVMTALQTYDNTLAVAPTGCGKTIMMSAAIGESLGLSPTGRVCVLAHRDELTFQNQSKFQRVYPHLSTSIFNASEKNWQGAVTFAMVQTLSREQNLATFPVLDMLVIDEAHHARAESYVRIIDYAKRQNPQLKLLGMTATPNRGDKKGLRSLFSNVADQITVSELIGSGHLVPPKTFAMDVGVRNALKQVKKTGSEYDMAEVSQIMNTRPVNEAVIHYWKEKAGDRQTVVFCSTVQHALDVAQSFISAGIAAVVVHGEMSEGEREKVILAYSSGAAQVIVNVAVLTEGWDDPPTSCVVLLRPSSYKSTMIQMIGRGLRIASPEDYPGVIKTDCVVLDFGTSTLFHGSLEDQINLDGYETAPGEAATKSCPDCGGEVPLAVQECPLCGYIFLQEKTQEQEIPLSHHEFIMREVDLLKKRSPFLWLDSRDKQKSLLASGFNGWGGIFLHNKKWVALGALHKQPARVLAIGEENVCLAAANDFMNAHESEKTAHKSKDWLYLPPSDNQLKWLPEHRDNKNLNRYQASALLTLKFNNTHIHKALKQEIC